MKRTVHTHPHPTLDRLAQYAAWLLAAVMLVAVIAQLLIALFGNLPVFLVSAALTALLLPPVLLRLTMPAVALDADGLWLQPQIGAARFVAWEDIVAVRPYPLLPKPENEVERRAFVGRRRYRPAEGVMLIVPTLPLYFRAAGLLAGARAQPALVLTNRTHTRYEQLIAGIKRRVGTRWQL